MHIDPSKVLKGSSRQFIHLFVALLISFGVLNACGGGGGGGSPNISPIGGGLETGEVRPFEFGENNTASMSFSDLSGSEEFTVLFFNAAIDNANYEVELQSLSDLPAAKLLSYREPDKEETEVDGDITGATHVWLREIEAGLSATEPVHTKAMAQGEAMCSGGAGIQIKVLNSLSSVQSYTTTCAIPVRNAPNAVYYVDEEVVNEIDGSALGAIIDDFESQIPVERNYLGSESDVNDDGKFMVYFTPAVNRLGNTGGGFVTGFFFGMDLVSSDPSGPSNQREILYICVPGNFGTNLSQDFWVSNIAPTVLPHEFQHMISFNNHVLERDGNAEIASFNEGLSHFLEDLSASTSLNQVSVENPSRVSLFLRSTDSAPFTSGISIAQRGGAYLFFRYLYEQANLGRYPNSQDGSALLENLSQTDKTGIPNVEAATGLAFKDLLLDFYATLQLSNTGLTANDRYNFSGINLHGAQNDNRGTVLDGISTEVVSGAGKGLVSSPGGLYFSLTGSDIINSGQDITLSAAEGTVPGGAVIRLK